MFPKVLAGLSAGMGFGKGVGGLDIAKRHKVLLTPGLLTFSSLVPKLMLYLLGIILSISYPGKFPCPKKSRLNLPVPYA